ncbi:SPOSA6832_01372, partial [Sporobolomyces salmonicolor]
MSTAATAPPKRGAFIVFEGLDRSGKSTQVARLVEGLTARGVKAVRAGFPERPEGPGTGALLWMVMIHPRGVGALDRTLTTGKMIDSYLSQKADLDDRAIHLLFSANRWERANQILEDLSNGVTVVCDRYAFSGIAFSVIKGISWTWCQSPDMGLPAPDLVLFLSIPPSAAASRGGFGQERYETSEVQLAVKDVFEQLGRTMDDGVWNVVDADRTVDAVEADVRARVEAVLASARLDGDVKRLWDDERATS